MVQGPSRLSRQGPLNLTFAAAVEVDEVGGLLVLPVIDAEAHVTDRPVPIENETVLAVPVTLPGFPGSRLMVAEAVAARHSETASTTTPTGAHLDGANMVFAAFSSRGADPARRSV